MGTYTTLHSLSGYDHVESLHKPYNFTEVHRGGCTCANSGYQAVFSFVSGLGTRLQGCICNGQQMHSSMHGQGLVNSLVYTQHNYKYVASRQSTYLNFHVWFIIIFWFYNSGFTRVHFFPVDIVLLHSGHCDHVFTFNKECLSLLMSNEVNYPIVCLRHQLQCFWVTHLNCL